MSENEKRKLNYAENVVNHFFYALYSPQVSDDRLCCNVSLSLRCLRDGHCLSQVLTRVRHQMLDRSDKVTEWQQRSLQPDDKPLDWKCPPAISAVQLVKRKTQTLSVMRFGWKVGYHFKMLSCTVRREDGSAVHRKESTLWSCLCWFINTPERLW